ncbi:unnamed protein product [Leptidea sinapis]|uniref:Uncharacterized protein n=1 Tax=Leptidea sinapis TaxID=189913 RepID=A0A5E4R8A3_9NEOP|nr:unnamed protein product [Leptidea sinapis]
MNSVRIHVPYEVRNVHHHHVSSYPVYKPVPVIKEVPVFHEVPVVKHVPVIKPVPVPIVNTVAIERPVIVPVKEHYSFGSHYGSGYGYFH